MRASGSQTPLLMLFKLYTVASYLKAQAHSKMGPPIIAYPQCTRTQAPQSGVHANNVSFALNHVLP